MNRFSFLKALFVAPFAGFFRRKHEWQFAGKSVVVGEQQYVVTYWFKYHDGEKVVTEPHRRIMDIVKSRIRNKNIHGVGLHTAVKERQARMHDELAKHG